MDAISNLKSVKDNWHVCSKWEVEQQEKDACFDYLKENKKYTDKDLSVFKWQGETLTRAINVLAQLGINKSENALVSINTACHLGVNLFGVIGLGAGYLFSKLKKSPLKTPKTSAFIGYTIATLIAGAVASFISAHFAKTGTRIARYQTRNNELRDVKNFVTYTDEQIAEAKIKLASMPEVKDITDDMSMKDSSNPLKVFKKSIETAKILKKDYDNYKNWHKEYSQKEIERNKKLSQMQISKSNKEIAEQDKNFVLDTIRKLELSSNKYELNTDFAVKMGASLLSILTVAGGFALSWGLNRMSCISKLAKFATPLNYIQNYQFPLVF